MSKPRVGLRQGSRSLVETQRWRVAIVGFSHMHAGDQIRLALDNPSVELVGVWDEDLDRPKKPESGTLLLPMPLSAKGMEQESRHENNIENRLSGSGCAG